MYKAFFKRILDLTISLFLLVVLSPLLLVIVILLYLNFKKPFFIQPRVGKGERLFKIAKFRTLKDEKNSTGEILSYKERLTPFGNFLRKYSLDELPQLINILKGDMSLVGPRPLLIEYLPLYSEEQRRRHNAMPGVTGWAQVNGRNKISWTEKFKYDLYYVEHLSFRLDLKILWMTLVKVLRKKDVSYKEGEDNPMFNGNN